MGSPPEEYSYTKAQLIERAKEFMKNNFSDADPDWYYTRLGLLVDFVGHITPSIGEMSND